MNIERFHRSMNFSFHKYIAPRGRVAPELQLGEACNHPLECLLSISHGTCDFHERRCTCQPYHARLNDTICLPASLLGYGCIIDEQCTIKVANSQCRDGLCHCQQGFMPLRKDLCLPHSPLEERKHRWSSYTPGSAEHNNRSDAYPVATRSFVHTRTSRLELRRARLTEPLSLEA
ncbi:hypothetical protein LAZ67_2006520 [Cordylochernes scorpioides]|uniref:EB domain-containing protein n=1 Tax=Cordylochernes scorpioides TaxID=51811 RepID=A0ABY6K8R6_9ARAC|nr:hypothetical protein LAZ67_2006520 [Cordylochernes scorpioides]